MGEPSSNQNVAAEISTKDIMEKLEDMNEMIRISFKRINNLESIVEESLEGSQKPSQPIAFGEEDLETRLTPPQSPSNVQGKSIINYGPTTFPKQ